MAAARSFEDLIVWQTRNLLTAKLMRSLLERRIRAQSPEGTLRR